jgi:hypothetical protein
LASKCAKVYFIDRSDSECAAAQNTVDECRCKTNLLFAKVV